MAAVPADVKQQTDHLDYCCYGEACLVPPPTTRAKQAKDEQGYSSRHNQYVRYSYAIAPQPRIGTPEASFGLTTQELCVYF